MAVVGVPKTIDNDILLMDKTFGFDTAVEEAQRAINSAYIEVTSIAFYHYCGIHVHVGPSLNSFSFHSIIVLLSFPVLEVVI